VETILRTIDPQVAYRAVHASRGKVVCAEPVAGLYEQVNVHHVGALGFLEDQMCKFMPGDLDGSPDRVDALVWGITELMLDEAREPLFVAW
jgi:phage terminase large subunit-like protein